MSPLRHRPSSRSIMNGLGSVPEEREVVPGTRAVKAIHRWVSSGSAASAAQLLHAV